MNVASTRISSCCGIIRRNGQPCLVTRTAGQPDKEQPLPERTTSTKDAANVTWHITHHADGSFTVHTAEKPAGWVLEADGSSVMREVVEWSGPRPTSVRYRAYSATFKQESTSLLIA